MSPLSIPGKMVLGNTLSTADPYYNNVSLLLHGNGDNGSTDITDTSLSSKTVTAFGNAQISTAQSKFGGSSLAFDGSGDYLSTGSNSAFNFGTADFTVEAWIRVANFSSQYQTITGTRPGALNSTTGWTVGVLGTSTPLGSQCLFFYTNGIVATANNTINLGTWHHVAFTRAGTDLRLFIDGAQLKTATNNQNLTDQTLYVGANFGVSEYFNGYIDDLRITKGVARYTSNFTPPTTPHPDLWT